ncbi:MAG: hypothetical protein GXO11_07920 [Epsilonproteobacteria bacterium]|nr:hypothetical protein [Campylobacterota bacterium]
MKKMVFVTSIITVLLTVLIFVFFHLNSLREDAIVSKDKLNLQKTHTQNIAKEVLYIYTKKTDDKKLSASLEKFLDGLGYIKDDDLRKRSELFTQKVLEFKEQVLYQTPYSKILLDKTVHHIYILNQKLLQDLDDVIQKEQNYISDIMNFEKVLQYSILLFLFIIFIYLVRYILKEQSSFEVLIRKIESSVKSIDEVEEQVEKYLEENEDIKDETLIIESLEELTKANIRLKQLQKKLQQNN